MGLTNLSTKRQRIAELARSKRGVALSTLHHVIDLEWMKEAYRLTRKDGATGIDGVTAADYAQNLEANLWISWSASSPAATKRRRCGGHICPKRTDRVGPSAFHDAVMAFADFRDAKRVLDVLGKRLARYELTLRFPQQTTRLEGLSGNGWDIVHLPRLFSFSGEVQLNRARRLTATGNAASAA